MKKALVIFSGGQDSATCLLWALNFFDEVQCINFNYGQKHSIEVEAAQAICETWNVPLKLVDISFLGELVKSALTDHGNVNELNEIGLPSSFVPNRNQLFITLAHAYAQKIGYNTLVTGVCQTDYSGYPDCRERFITAIQDATNLGSAKNITIDTPLMFLTKAQTFQFAETLDKKRAQDIISMSHTCYNGSRTVRPWGKGCGECPACKLRKAGFEEYLENATRLQK